jgi:apolipoprotein D and lipocalin family protein
MFKALNYLVIGLVCLILTTGCASQKMNEIPLVSQVDLAKFMGDWYVIAVIPTAIETEAFNAIENYKLNDDGTIATTFTFNKASFDGKAKKYEPKGFVQPDTGNALWGMQFVWPIKAEYRIAYLDSTYQTTIIARNARDYVWLMARTPKISDIEYQKLTALIKGWGYDVSKLIKVPQQALNARDKKRER